MEGRHGGPFCFVGSRATQTARPRMKQPGNVITPSEIGAPKPAYGAGWIADCQKDGAKVVNNVSNALLALRNDPALSSAIALDEMLQVPFLMEVLPGGSKSADFVARPLTDHDVTLLQEYLQRCGLMRIGKDVVHQAVDLRA